jgi:hypothetical protein
MAIECFENFKMPSLQQEYLQYISREIFPGNAHPEFQYGTFIERFDPDRYQIRSRDLAEKLSHTEGKDYVSGVNQHIKEVIKKIDRIFRDELERDGITEQQQGHRGAKRADEQSPWQKYYQWLWEIKYDRWLQEYIWESWKKTAETNIVWMEFCDRYCPKAMTIPQALPKQTIPVNTPLNLKINLDSPGYLLLFNRGVDELGNQTKYLVTPSQAFAPSYQLMENSILLPLEDAMSHNIDFNAVGKEEYIGIVIDKALDLPWLNPSPEQPVLEWQGKHLEQVWQQLHGNKSRVFYRDFNIVSS